MSRFRHERKMHLPNQDKPLGSAAEARKHCRQGRRKLRTLRKRINRKNSRHKFQTMFRCPDSLRMRRRNLSPSWGTPQNRHSETTSTSTVNKFSNSSINNSGKAAAVDLKVLVQHKMAVRMADRAVPVVLRAAAVVGVINAVAAAAAEAGAASRSAAAAVALAPRDRAEVSPILCRILRSTLRRTP